MAEFTGTVQLQKSVAELLAASDDPALIASLLPGCEALHRIDAEHIEGRLATEVAGVPVTAIGIEDDVLYGPRQVRALVDDGAALLIRLRLTEIGRASCRERV